MCITLKKKQTIYDSINRLQQGATSKDNKKTNHPISWIPTRTNQLKRFTNNQKMFSQRRFGRKLGVSHVTISRKLSKMKISCYKRDKTPKNSENRQKNQKKFGR